jgi:hypothetical protein
MDIILETAEKFNNEHAESIDKCMKQGIKVLVEVEQKTNLDREEHHKQNIPLRLMEKRSLVG